MPTTTTTTNDAGHRPSFISRWILDFHNRTVLFRIGNWLFTTYAFLAGTAFATGFLVSLWFNSMTGLDAVYMAKLYLFLVVPAVLVGLRAFSVMLEWRELFRRPLQTLIKPGYMLHGGIAGGTIGLIYVASVVDAPVLRILDAPAFALPLGEAIARLGCFVYGCCWGRPTRSRLGSRFGVRYTSKESKVVRCAPHLENVKIHPAQLYALVIYLAMFAVFYAILPYLPFDGALTGMYLIGHSIIRYSLEYFRQDDRGRLWGKLTHTNLYSALMVLGGIVAIAYGSMYGGRPAPDMGIRLVHVLFDGSIFPWLVLYGLVFGFAYGVHYKKVGSWITSPSSGMKPNIDELSMGAVSRMEAKARGDEHDDA
ncbi:MAG: prolipoprotein diacylglyceryl transferase [Myxococcales bacterium]|nr:prolipoprotein diacylglyceryl transferase [Myxococcales bacterium]MCB9718504.1 prolipoprotein diacylglyceryl transferase [Myxococcales bacterium]